MEHKEGILLGGSIAALGVVLLLIIAMALSSSLQGHFGGPMYQHTVLVSGSVCKVENRSCEVVLTNTGTNEVVATRCVFETYFGNINGSQSSQSIYTDGVLSNRPGGPATTVSFAGNSSTVVYCSAMGIPSYAPKASSPVVGYVRFGNPREADVVFFGAWK